MPIESPTRPGSSPQFVASRGTTLTQFTADASAALGGPNWLARRREAAFGRFEDLPFPSESEEVWRYSGIDEFDVDLFAPAPVPPDGERREELALAAALADRIGARSGLVVTRDGVVRSVEVTPGLEEGALTLASARLEGSGDDLQEGFGDLSSPRDAFGEMHDAFLADAVVVSVGPKATLADPVVVVHLSSSVVRRPSAAELASAPASFPRTLVRIGRSAEAGVIEMVASCATGFDSRSAPVGTVGGLDANLGPSLVVPVTELHVGEDARLAYANLQLLSRSSTCVALQASGVERDGSLRSFTAGLGGTYARVRTDSELRGQGASSSLLAGYLGTEDQVHDFRTLQDHHAARTRSELLFEGAVADRSRSVYSGLIRIARGAHGADAFQTNHNLVLSEGAHADSVPNLDIDENDVRCSHASTVGPIDEEQRYYLESRGIEPSVAERLIVLGFFSNLAARAPLEAVGSFLEEIVAKRLSGRLPSEQARSSRGEGDG